MKTRLAKNTFSSLVLQITTIICGFILPRLILSSFGSDVNGLVNSITQFLQMIAFLDLGVGAVVQSSFYKPLAEKNDEQLSKIFVSGQRFFSKLARILIVYVIVLVIIFPVISANSFGFFYSALLIVAMSVSLFAQYYMGMMNGILITADQRGYIQYSIQTVSIIINTVMCFALIKIGATIHIVKLVSSVIFLIRPLLLFSYVKKNYNINYEISYKEEPIKQKWNGLAQHISSVILESTDTIVLTMFSTFSNVSIYSVYYLVIAGIKQLFYSLTYGIQSLMGELYAKEKFDEIQQTFEWTEWLIHTATTFVFGCTYTLIVPFVITYTLGIDDADYKQPLFAALLVLAYAFYCYRLPYHIMIKACVKYKETQKCYIVSAMINIVVSVLTVIKLGLIGVAIGTLVAMLYQTVWMAWYTSKNIPNIRFCGFIKQLIIDAIILIVGIMTSGVLKFETISYVSWVIMALKCSAIWIVYVLLINVIFYKNKIKHLLCKYIKYRRLL